MSFTDTFHIQDYSFTLKISPPQIKYNHLFVDCARLYFYFEFFAKLMFAKKYPVFFKFFGELSESFIYFGMVRHKLRIVLLQVVWNNILVFWSDFFRLKRLMRSLLPFKYLLKLLFGHFIFNILEDIYQMLSKFIKWFYFHYIKVWGEIENRKVYSRYFIPKT